MNTVGKVVTAIVLSTAGPLGGLLGLGLLMSDDSKSEADEKFNKDVEDRAYEKRVDAAAEEKISSSPNHK